MKLSQLIKKLQFCLNEFGDLDTVIIDQESGYFRTVLNVIKLHPFTLNGCMNRNDLVNKIEISCYSGSPDDLIIK